MVEWPRVLVFVCEQTLRAARTGAFILVSAQLLSEYNSSADQIYQISIRGVQEQAKGWKKWVRSELEVLMSTNSFD